MKLAVETQVTYLLTFSFLPFLLWSKTYLLRPPLARTCLLIVFMTRLERSSLLGLAFLLNEGGLFVILIGSPMRVSKLTFFEGPAAVRALGILLG